MVVPTEDNQPLSSTEQNTKFIWSPKGKILILEIALCAIATICKAASFGCYLWGCVTELVWAILILIIYALDLAIYLHLSLMYIQWLDLFRTITGSLILLITSLICISWGMHSFGEVIGLIFGLLAAAVLGYDAYGIINYIKNLKLQGPAVNVIVVQNVAR